MGERDSLKTSDPESLTLSATGPTLSDISLCWRRYSKLGLALGMDFEP